MKTDGGMETQEYKELRALFDKLDRRLDRIETVLVGDEFQTDGFVHRLENVEKKTRQLDYKLSRLIAYCLGAGAGSAGVTQLILRILGV